MRKILLHLSFNQTRLERLIFHLQAHLEFDLLDLPLAAADSIFNGVRSKKEFKRS